VTYAMEMVDDSMDRKGMGNLALNASLAKAL
jgi:hypothetical protein